MKNLLRTILCSMLLVTSAWASSEEQPVQTESTSTNVDLTQKMRDESKAYIELCRKLFNNNIQQVIVNEQCPTLCSMLKQLCDEFQIKVPELRIHIKNPIAQNISYYTGDCSEYAALSLKFSEEYEGMIVLGEDVLLHEELGLTYDELKAIMAHELAHLKLNHIPEQNKLKRNFIAAEAMVCAAMFAALYKYSHNFYKAHNVTFMGYDSINIYRGINCVLYATFFFTMDFGCGLYIKSNSRKHEQEADITSVQINKDAKSLVRGLEKLEKMMEKKETLPALIKNKIKSVFRTHPLTVDRERYLQ